MASDCGQDATTSFTDYLPQGAITVSMYEGPIHAADFAGADESPILRQLRWTDLVARIAASREARPAAVVDFEEPAASFAAFHSEADVGGHGEGRCEGHGRVNHNVLSHGKWSRIIPPDAANNAGPATGRYDD